MNGIAIAAEIILMLQIMEIMITGCRDNIVHKTFTFPSFLS